MNKSNTYIGRTIPFLVLFFSTLVVSTSASWGHQGGHNQRPPALSNAQVIAQATKDVAIIVDSKGKEKVEGVVLDSSWKSISSDNKKIVKKDRGAVVVSFKNTKKKKTLFVLLLDYGKYIGANFTGKFEGL